MTKNKNCAIIIIANEKGELLMKEITVSREFIYHKFDEKKNEIVVDEEQTYTAERTMTIEEARQYRKAKRLSCFFKIVSIILFIALFVSILSLSLSGILFRTFGLKPSLIALCLFLCVVLFAFSIQPVLIYDNKVENLLEYFSNSGFIIENIGWEAHELEVNDEAKRWRESHPLEEKIRLAKESGNCVDIAAVLKYCGEDLIDKIKH